MPRYFFHSADGGRSWDEAGIDLPDDQTARIEAIRLIGAVLKDEPQLLRSGNDFRVEVTDAASRLLFTIVTLAIDAPNVPTNDPTVPGAEKSNIC